MLLLGYRFIIGEVIKQQSFILDLYHELKNHAEEVAATTNDNHNLDNLEEVRHYENLVNTHLVCFDTIGRFRIILNELAQIFGLHIFI